jgi:acetyl-CoA carboxylase biotin carboxylase subunit
VFRRVLVANRGEIALRIVRTCAEMDVCTVAVHSTVDADRLSVQYADQAICIGNAPAAESYLNMGAIVSAALCMECDAVHPGFGFLSENADFAQMCKDAGLTFIGPSPCVIRTLGDKAAARALVAECGVPVVPGSRGVVHDADAARRAAEQVGYPVLIKASAGGGGRGMRRADHAEGLAAAFDAARSEALACFGDDAVYVEKLIENPRHIEIQILADSFGHVVHLGERECSIQRNNQKLVEESPSPALDGSMRSAMGDAAVRIAQAAGYSGAGTVEFVVSGSNFYFIEMNARIQVEHPVTEMRCGLDLVREQLRIAAGLPLRFEQDDIVLKGHAIECRIIAEDPRNNFHPSPGHVGFLHFPGGNGVRVDSDLYAGSSVSPFYDSMIAKVIVCAPTRLEAVRKMRRALEETVVEGISTNLDLALLIMFNGDFLKGSYHTGFIGQNLGRLLDFDDVVCKLDSEEAAR